MSASVDNGAGPGEGSEPAARGEVHITNPPPPPELGLDLSMSADGEANVIKGM